MAGIANQRAGPAILLADETPVDQLAERLDRVGAVEAGRHPLGRLEPEPAAEDAEAQQQLALVVAQQPGAPLDGRLHGALALGQVACAAGEQRQRVVEPVDHRLGRQDARTGGGELERERRAVERSADRVDGRRVLVGHREVGLDGPGPLHEQVGGHGRGKRAEVDALLAADPQQDPARGEHGDRGGPEQRTERRGGVDDLLDVVEHQQHATVAQCDDDPLRERCARPCP